MNQKFLFFLYIHFGALVLKGEKGVAISRLLCNDQKMLSHLNEIIGNEQLYSCLEGGNLSGMSILKLEEGVKRYLSK